MKFPHKTSEETNSATGVHLIKLLLQICMLIDMARGIISMLEGSGLSLDVTMEFLTDIEGLKDVYVIPNASFATVTGDDSVNHIISMSSSPKFNSIDTMPLILSECNDILLVESSSNEFEVSFEVLDMSSEI